MADVAELGLVIKTTDLARANVELDRLAQGSRRAEQGASRIAGAADRLNQRFNNVFRTLVSVQGALAGIGAGFAIQRVVREFSDFERQLVEVGKTADLQGQQLQRLGQRIQDIGQRVAVPTDRLLDLAAAAGQIGVKGVEDIARFAETMGQLELATDVAGEEGARALGRLLNITGRSASEIDRLGSAVTALGNNMAATEQEIVRASTFLGSATAQFGLTTEEVVGLSGALVALGQRAETSGSAIGRALTGIQEAVTQGGESLRTLQELTGQTQTQLQQAFGEDTVGLLLDFAEGLGETIDQGNRYNEVLDEFGLASQEARRVIGALVSDVQSARDAVARANTEWELNQALTREAARQADTFSGQMTLVANAFNEAAVIAGREFAPVLLDIADDFREFLQDAADSGALESFFERAADAARRFLEELERIGRIILALGGGLRGAALGGRIGAAAGPGGAAVGTVGGGLAGALAGFFAPEALGALARSLGEETRALEVAQNRVEALVKRQAELRRLLRVDEEGNIPQAIRESQEALAARSDEPTGLEEFERLPERIAEARFELAQIREEMSPTTAAAEAMAGALLESAEAANDNAEETGDQSDATATLRERIAELLPELRENIDITVERTKAGQAAIDRLQEQVNAEGDLARQKFIEAEVQRAQNEAMARGNLLREETIADIERLSGRLFDLRGETEDNADTIDDLGFGYKTNAELMLESTREFVRGSQGELADFFDDFFRGQINSIGDLWDGMLDVMRRSLAEFIAAVATQRIILPVGLAAIGGGGILAGTGGGGGIGGASNALSAGGQLASLGGFDLGASLNSIGFSSGIFGAGSSGAAGALNVGSSVGVNGFNIAGASSAAPSSATGIFGTSATLSSTLGAAGLGALGGGLLSNLVGLNQTGGSIGGGLGAGAGALIGAIPSIGLPVVGPIVGGLLGTVGGGLIGDLFGDSQPSRAISRGFTVRNGQLTVSSRASDEASEEQEQAFRQLEQTITQRVNSFVEAIGGELSGGSFSIGSTRRSGIVAAPGSLFRGQNRSFDSLQDAANFGVQSLLTSDSLRGLSGNIEDAVRRGLEQGLSLDQISQNVQRLRQLGFETGQITLSSAIQDTGLGNRARQFFQQITGPLEAFNDNLAFGQRSSLSPGEQLANARGEFARVAQAAQGGNLGAIERLPDLGQRVIELGRLNFASGPRAAQIEQRVSNQISSVLGEVEQRRDSLFAEFGIRLEDSIDTQTDTLARGIEQLRTELTSLRQEVRNLRRVA